MAAAAGEVAKDAKHLAMVEKVGGDVIPLCVECFGVWTPFALSTLNSIADRTTTCSGITRKLARKNLLQQLSKLQGKRENHCHHIAGPSISKSF